MTSSEALSLLEALTAAFPTYPLSKPTASLYVAALAGVEAGTAQAAAARWVQEQERFPTVSQLLAACRAVHGRYPPLPALPPAPRVAPSAFRRGLAAARASLRDRRNAG